MSRDLDVDASIARVVDPQVRDVLQALADETRRSAEDPAWQREVQRRRNTEAHAAAQLEAQRVAWLRSRGIPERHLDAILRGALEETVALRSTRAWIADAPPGSVLLLLGPPDAGKSCAASWAVAQDPPRSAVHYRRGRAHPWPAELAPAFVAAEHLARIMEHRPRFEDVDQREPVSGRTWSELLGCYLLALDDLGQEASRSRRHAEAADILLRSRCDRGLLTIVPANFKTPEELVSHLGPRGVRFAERLLEYGTFIRCPAVGFRRRR